MNRLSKISGYHPFGHQNQLINIIFLSEGYLVNEKKYFLNSCKKFINSIQNYCPFNLLSIYPIVNFYTYFIPSEIKGISIKGDGQKGKTVFGAEVDPEKLCLNFDPLKVSNVVNDLVFNDGSKEIRVTSLVDLQDVPNQYSRTIIVILCPQLEELDGGLNVEWFPELDEPYFIATTLNRNWEQVIIRSLCKVFNLSDEEEIIETASQENNENFTLDFLAENIMYDDLSDTNIKWSDIKWKNLIPTENHNNNIEIKISKNDFPPNLYNPDNLELWTSNHENGIKIFRTAEHCLMRHRIGDSTQPINHTNIPLCNICEFHIRGKIIQTGRLITE